MSAENPGNIDPANCSISDALKDLKAVAKSKDYQFALANMKEIVGRSSLLQDIEEDVNSPLDSEMRAHTVKLTFPYAGKPFLHDEILEALSVCGISPKDLMAVGPLSDNYKWLVTLATKDAVVAALRASSIVRGYTARVFSMTTSLVQCRIHWLPAFVSQSHVAVFMSRYGKVHSIKWDKSKLCGYDPVRTTVRNLVIEVLPGKELPSRENIIFENELHTALITLPGRGPVCFRCNKIGHTRSTCNTVYCCHCVKFDAPSSEDCTRANSYAVKVAAESGSTDKGDMKGDLPEEVADVISAESFPTSKKPTVDDGEKEEIMSQEGDSFSAVNSVEEDNHMNQDDEGRIDVESLTSSQTLMKIAKEQDPDFFVSADDADVSSDSTASQDIHLNKKKFVHGTLI